ncbi:MAG: cytochrome c [Prosthecobacter sp.]|jgi:nitrite reductase (NO-forming)
MSHHHSPSGDSTGSKIAGMGFSIFGYGLAGVVLFFSGTLFLGAIKASLPRPPVAVAPPEAPAPVTVSSPASGPPPAAPGSAPAPAVVTSDLPGFEEGRTLFTTICAVCHQPTGMGLPGMFPPLAGTDWVNAAGPDRVIRMVLHGFMGPITINGKPFTTPAPMMPPQGALPDKQIAAVLTYVRNSFGNKASAVTPEQVKAIRDAEKARVAMWDEASILKIPITGKP